MRTAQSAKTLLGSSIAKLGELGGRTVGRVGLKGDGWVRWEGERGSGEWKGERESERMRGRVGRVGPA